MSLDIFGTENQMVKLESDFSNCFFISKQMSKRSLKERKGNIYYILYLLKNLYFFQVISQIFKSLVCPWLYL